MDGGHDVKEAVRVAEPAVHVAQNAVKVLGLLETGAVVRGDEKEVEDRYIGHGPRSQERRILSGSQEGGFENCVYLSNFSKCL